MAYKVTDIEGKELVVGTDYTASLNNSSVEDEFSVKDAGDYTLTITAIENGSYTGSKSVVFSVVKSNLENAVFSGINPCYRYIGDEIGLSYKVIDSEGNVLVVGSDYTASLNNSSVEDEFSVKDVGDYTLTITAKDGSIYTGSKEISFVVYSDYVPVRAFTFSMDGSYGVPYKVDKDVSIDERISIIGDVRLILDEGLTLNALKGIELSENNKLIIEGEGMLNAVGENLNSGIGAYNVGTLVINGGKINAAGGDGGAGIGGSVHNIGGGVITINDGIVNATGGNDAAGIGGGYNNWAGDYGVCGLITVNGGKVTANAGKDASGIGPGYNGKTSGSVILGWTNDDDFIYAKSFNVESICFAKNFYYIENGEKKVASIDDIADRTLYPITSVDAKDLFFASFSGLYPYCLYTGNEIDLTYKVMDIDGKELVKETDYTESITPFPVKDEGEYTLTIMAKDGSDYTGVKTISFSVLDYIPVTESTFTMDGSYGVPYKVDKDVSIDERISIIGDVRLILDEGLTLNALKGIELSENNKLIIEGEGMLNAVGENLNSGIGAYNVGTLVINGGKINAAGGDGGAGIGGSVHNIGGGVITINDGIVNATGGNDAAGIGGGYNNWAGDYGVCGLITVNGGKVTANAGEYAPSGIGPGAPSGIGPGDNGITSGSVILGWTNEDDFIYASNFNNISSLTFAENKQFYYTENGVNKVASIDDIASKELHPYFGDHNLENASISGIELSYAYTGKAISPAYQIVDFKGLEISKANYVVSIMKDGVESQAVNIGEYTMVFTGKGEYRGTKEVNFSIVPKVILASGAIQVFEDENGKRAEIAGEYDGAEAVNITEDIKNVAVTFNREFTPNSGYATIMFPFDVKASSLTGVRSVIEFDGVKTDKNDNKTVGMRYVWCNATLGEQEELNKHPNCNGYSGELKAYTPYMIEMESATLGIKDAVTLKSNSGKIVGDAPVGNWVFRGTLQKKEWPKGTGIINEGRLWAFAAAERSGAKIGEFVQFGGNNWANPFRAYLVECKKTDNGLDCKDDSETQPKPSLVSRYRFADALAPTNSAEKLAGTAATDQPLVLKQAAASETASLNSMDIVIVYGDKDSDKERPTVIGRFNPSTGEIRMLPRTKQTYDLKGRKVGNGKKAKGAYYNRR